MVRPPMFSRCVSVRYEQAHDAPLSAPEAGLRRLTAGGIIALVALTVVTLVLAALVGMMAGLAPTLMAEASGDAEAPVAFAHADHTDMPRTGETAQP